MLQFKIREILVQIDFVFLTLTAVLFIFFNDYAFFIIAAIFIHEFTHIAVMKCFNVKILKIHFSAGIVITPKSGFRSEKQDFLIAISAPAVNFLLALIFINTEFGLCNFFLGLLNVLPSKGFDGGTAFGIIFKKIGVLTTLTLMISVAYMLINGFNIFLAIIIFFIIIENV